MTCGPLDLLAQFVAGAANPLLYAVAGALWAWRRSGRASRLGTAATGFALGLVDSLGGGAGLCSLPVLLVSLGAGLFAAEVVIRVVVPVIALCVGLARFTIATMRDVIAFLCAPLPDEETPPSGVGSGAEAGEVLVPDVLEEEHHQHVHRPKLVVDDGAVAEQAAGPDIASDQRRESA